MHPSLTLHGGGGRGGAAAACFACCADSVSVRVRPLNRQEQSEGFAWKVENNSMYQVDPATQEPERVRDARYMLDHIFSPKQSTREIYATTTQSLIQKLVHGFNSTVFAYGQTSSGKTHTMRGTPDEPGIIPMAVQEVFSLIEQSQDREFLLRVSYMEVSTSHSRCDACAGAWHVVASVCCVLISLFMLHWQPHHRSREAGELHCKAACRCQRRASESTSQGLLPLW